MGHKADFNKTSLSGGNAVYFACKSVTLNLSYVLADVAGGAHLRHGQVKCLQILLERGAVVAADKSGVTPLQLCAQVHL